MELEEKSTKKSLLVRVGSCARVKSVLLNNSAVNKSQRRMATATPHTTPPHHHTSSTTLTVSLVVQLFLHLKDGEENGTRGGHLKLSLEGSFDT
ncbi:hypothetical protein C0Q70_00028 [Pomacea canaliculata]|uniref:Uncharacterized protein n=1 Tax=Pomacea canaliculata TaxID=400727 RepID=A0A2T7PVJ5_POMCA|nr:hypothetical protein C0Q70_00028 [Pomacea canaliculata]